MEIYDKKILGQLRPSDTNAASIVNPTKFSLVSGIMICNTTSSASTYRIFLDDDGSTYDADTALFYDIPIDANSTDMLEWDDPLPLNNSSANLAVRSGTSNALNFTVYGKERVN